MITHPQADELLSAVIGFIERLAPDLKDRDVFLARVAVNALNTVRREMSDGPSAETAARAGMAVLLGQDGKAEDLNRTLCIAIREGRFDHDEAALLRHLRASAVDQVRIDQPNYSGLKIAEGAAS